MENSSLRKRLGRLLDCLEDGLIERETPVRLALLTAISGEHLLLIGSPGTAKSALARKLHLAFEEGHYFERLLTKFSVPEELFGPLSIKALEEDRYQRLTKRYLPSANIAFIDEIFKANSAILNSLLTLLNEKEFDNGDQRVKVPLISVIGASNELPEEEELQALYDRFLCRYFVKPVSDQRFEDLLQLKDISNSNPDSADRLTKLETEEIQQQAEQLELAKEVVELLTGLRKFLQDNQLSVSDRRWRKVVKLLKVSAYTNQQQSVTIWDCWLLQHCLWDAPEKQKLIANWYEAHVGIGSGFNPQRLDKLVRTWEAACVADSESEVQVRDAQGNLVYKTKEGEQTNQWQFTEWSHRDGEPLYKSPPDQEDRSNVGRGFTVEELKQQFFDDRYQQTHIDGKWQHIEQYTADPENRLIAKHENARCMEPTKHPEDFIQARLQETQSLQADIILLKDKLQEQIDSLGIAVGEHLWIDTRFSKTAEQSLNKSKVLAESLLERLAKVIKTYNDLPRL